MAGSDTRRKAIEAAKALETLSDALGPNPINPVVGGRPPCKPDRKRLAKEIIINPRIGANPPCRPLPIPWVWELQTTLLEMAAWLRYLATAPTKAPERKPRPRPKSRPLPKRGQRRPRK